MKKYIMFTCLALVSVGCLKKSKDSNLINNLFLLELLKEQKNEKKFTLTYVDDKEKRLSNLLYYQKGSKGSNPKLVKVPDSGEITLDVEEKQNAVLFLLNSNRIPVGMIRYGQSEGKVGLTTIAKEFNNFLIKVDPNKYQNYTFPTPKEAIQSVKVVAFSLSSNKDKEQEKLVIPEDVITRLNNLKYSIRPTVSKPSYWKKYASMKEMLTNLKPDVTPLTTEEVEKLSPTKDI